MVNFLSAWRRHPETPRDCFRPLLPVTLAFALGIGSRAIGPNLDVGCLVLAAVAAAWTGWQLYTLRRSYLAPLLLFWSLGYGALAPWLPNHYPPQHISHFTDGSRYRVVGTVDQPPWSTPDQRLRLVLRVEGLESSGTMQTASGRLRLTIFGDAPLLHAGDRLAFESRLRPIRSFRNPGGFNYQRFMAYKQITATAWTRGANLTVMAVAIHTQPVLRGWREHARQTIESVLTGDSQAVIKALTIGDRSAISTSLRDVFNRLGIGHLLAISGLHVGIIALTLMAIFKWIFNRSHCFLKWGAGHAAAVCATIPIVIAYGVMAGMAPSTQRAVIMVALGLGAYLVRREADTLNLLALAGLLILVWHPPMLLAVGFQMSFAAVLAIVLGLRYVWPGAPDATPSPRGGPARRLLVFMAVTAYATAGTLPLLMYYFQQFSLIGLVANLVAVPLIGFVVLPLGLTGISLLPLSSSMASLCLQGGGILLDAVMTVARWVSAFEFVALRSFQPTGLEIGIYYVMLAALLAIRTYPSAKWLLAAAAVGLGVDAGWWYHYRFAHHDLRVTVLDVGQGSATLLEFPGGRTMLVDGGGYADPRAFDMGRRVIAPFLLRRKILTVDYLVLSHPSSDHMNGLRYMVQHFQPRTFIWNHDRIESASARSFLALINDHPLSVPPFQNLERTMKIGGAIVRILNPPIDFDRRRGLERWRNLNNNSMALQLLFAGYTVLLPGDVERPAEQEMLRRVGPALKSTILLVPHHGSRSSSSTEFLAAVQPEYAIVSCGWRNRFNFPHPEVLARYRGVGSRILRTDTDGAIQIQLQPDGLRIVVDDNNDIRGSGGRIQGDLAQAFESSHGRPREGS
jgi:competence protein ComEC